MGVRVAVCLPLLALLADGLVLHFVPHYPIAELAMQKNLKLSASKERLLKDHFLLASPVKRRLLDRLYNDDIRKLRKTTFKSTSATTASSRTTLTTTTAGPTLLGTMSTGEESHRDVEEDMLQEKVFSDEEDQDLLEVSGDADIRPFEMDDWRSPFREYFNTKMTNRLMKGALEEAIERVINRRLKKLRKKLRNDRQNPILNREIAGIPTTVPDSTFIPTSRGQLMLHMGEGRLIVRQKKGIDGKKETSHLSFQLGYPGKRDVNA